MVRAEVGLLSAQTRCSRLHSRRLQFSWSHSPNRYLHSPPKPPSMLKMRCCSPPVAPISIPSVLSYHRCSSQPPHLSEGPPHSLSNTMARCLDNCRLPVFVGSAGRQLYSTPPLPPPPSHSTKAGISLSLHPLHTVALYRVRPLIRGSTRLRCCCWWLNLLAKTVFQPRESAQRKHRFKCSILPSDVYKSYILVNPFSVYLCAFCMYLIILTVSPWHHIVEPLEWQYNLLITVLMWQVLLFFLLCSFSMC